MKQFKKRIASMLLVLLTLLTILPTSAFAAVSTGTGITPTPDSNRWTTRLTSTGQSYSYRPPMAAGKYLYCMDLGYSYRYGTASFLNSYGYESATGADADALWEKAVAKTGLGEMDAVTKENVKWMMSYIADYTGEIPGSLHMALQTYIWDNQSDKSAGGDTSGDIDAGGFANADTYEQYVAYYKWLLGQKANEDAELQAQVERYTAEGKQASIVEDESSKWAVLAISGVSGRQSFFAYHSTRKVVVGDKPEGGDNPPPPVAGDGDITFKKVIAGTDRGLDGAVYNIYRDGQIVGSDVTSGGGIIEVNDVTEGLWTFVEREAPEGFALDPTPHSVYVDVTDGDKQYTVSAANSPLPSLKITKADAQTYKAVTATFLVESLTGSYSTTVTVDGEKTLHDLQPGVYRVTEQSVEEPYIKTGTHQDIALLAGAGTVEASFTNYQKPGLEILKKNIADGSPIAHVTYLIEQIDGSFSTSAETDSKGRIFLESVPVGSYKITETNVPSNVILCDVPQVIALGPGETRTTIFFNAVKPSLTILKRCEITKDPIPNTRFHIWWGSDNTTTGALDDLGTFYTDENGEIILTGDALNSGWYKVTEEAPASGFAPADEPTQEFYLAGNENAVKIWENRPLSAICVWKYDSVHPNVAIEGAVFQVRYLSGNTSGTGGTVIGTYRTSANGSFTVTGCKSGTYIIEELSSDGSHVIDVPPQTVYLSGAEQEVVQVYFGNSPKGSVLIKKVSSSDGAPLSDVQFFVTDSTGAIVGNGNGYFTTDSVGTILIDNLDPNTTLIIKETRAKPNFLLDDVPVTATVKAGQTVTVEVRNQPLGSLRILKYSSSDRKTPLEGVLFKLTYADGSVVDAENGKLSTSGLYYTDSNGEILINGVVGTIIATEVSSIPGYSIDEATRSQTVVVNPDDLQTLYFYNKPEKTLVLQKYIDDGNANGTYEPLAGVEFLVTDSSGAYIGPDNGRYVSDQAGRAVITDLTAGMTVTVREVKSVDGFVLDGTPQSIKISDDEQVQTLYFYNKREGGVELIKVNEADKSERIPNTTFEIRRVSDDALVDTVTTGSTGSVFVTLPDGGYYAVETESGKGFKLDPTPHYFTVSDGSAPPLVVTNRKMSGILIHKISTADGSGIYGVSFLLYDSNKNPIGQYTSDDQGYVYIDDLPGSGRYYLRELENEGYVPDTQLKTVYVTAGTTTEIEWENTPITGQIQVTKTSADYNSMNGWPAGTPIPNTVFEIYNYKTGNLVDTIKTGKNGIAVSKPLPLGRYQVIESQSADFYGLDKTPIDVEIEFAGQIIKAAMTNKSLYTNVSIKKTGYTEVMPGQSIRYDFSGIANNSTTSLTSFYWRDTLPAFTTLDKIVTGTYNVQGNYKIVYQTNLSGGTYRTLVDNLNTMQNYVLDASPAALGLASNERVTEFMVVFGIVPGNFRQVEAPRVYVTASKWLTGGSQIVNQADVGGVHNGQWIMATSRWVTKVYKPAKPLPRTGY